MRSHDDFWQAAYRRACETLKREGVDLDGWLMRTRPADDAAATAMVQSPGGFIDAMVGHADAEHRVLTLFVHEMAWDEAAVREQLRSHDSAEAMAAWWLVESLRSIAGRIRTLP